MIHVLNDKKKKRPILVAVEAGQQSAA